MALQCTLQQHKTFHCYAAEYCVHVSCNCPENMIEATYNLCNCNQCEPDYLLPIVRDGKVKSAQCHWAFDIFQPSSYQTVLKIKSYNKKVPHQNEICCTANMGRSDSSQWGKRRENYSTKKGRQLSVLFSRSSLGSWSLVTLFVLDPRPGVWSIGIKSHRAILAQ